MQQKILSVFCLIVGIVFLVSGLGKVVDASSFGSLIAEYGLGWLQLFAPLIAIIEVAVGLCFILRVYPKMMGVISSCLLAIFTVAFTYGHFKTGITDCGCFGAINILRDNVAFVYARNIILLSLSLYLALQYTADNMQQKPDASKKLILLGALLPAIFVSGLTYRIPASLRSTQPHHHHSIINKNINETPLRHYLRTVADSSYLAFFHTYTCPHCWSSIENLKQLQTSGLIDSIVSFAIVSAEFSADPQIKDAFIQSLGSIKTIEIFDNDENVRALINAVPTSFYVKNDTVKEIFSTVPHPFVFGKVEN